jgi:hypothetical protein
MLSDSSLFGLRYLDQEQTRPYTCRIAKPDGVPVAISRIEIESRAILRG